MNTDPKDKVIIKFDKASGSYAPGERASFSWKRARSFVKAGFAHYDDPDVKKKSSILEVESEDESGSSEIDTRSYGKSIEEVKVIIGEIDDADELERLWTGEMQNPQHEGGRKGVVTACRERAVELKEEDE